VFDVLSLAEKRETVFLAQISQDGEKLSSKLATFVPNKHLQLVDPKLKAYLKEGEGNFLTVELEAEYLARYVELSLDDADVVFSDNYIDVIPGQTHRITFERPEGWTIDDVGRALNVFSLYDSFA
jgi:beta-mannosidase